MPEGGYKWLIHDPGRHAEGYFEEFRCRQNPHHSDSGREAAEYAKSLCGDDLDKCQRLQAGVWVLVDSGGAFIDRVFLKCELYFYKALPSAEEAGAVSRIFKKAPYKPE